MPDDSNKVNSLIQLSSKYYRVDPEISVQYATEARELAELVKYQTGLAYALKSIGMGYYFQGSYLDVVIYWQESLNAFRSIGNKLGEANMLNNLGAVYFNEGDDQKALDNYLESLRVSEEIGDTLRIATALVNIGAVYFNKEKSRDMAFDYYLRALPLSEELGDFDAIATSAVNLGEIFLEHNDLDSALYYFEMAREAYSKAEGGNIPYALMNIGRVYAKQGDYQQAISYQNDAFEIAEQRDAKLEMAQSLKNLADTYEKWGDISEAISTYGRAEEIATQLDADYELLDIYEGLARNYANTSDLNEAIRYQLLYNDIKDTLYNAAMDKRLQAQSLEYDIETRQNQIESLARERELQEQRQRIIVIASIITGVLLILLLVGIYSRYSFVQRTNKIIARERDRSDKLLLNILPAETAEELKEKGSATPKHYKMVSVLFTDFKGFTKIAEKLTPQELVEELNKSFLEFDRIIDRHNLEKIKTIGDAYMCAGGIPAANTTNPVDIVRAGLEIKEHMEKLKEEREAKGEDYWELRIGIHTGQVIAGVVGKNKFAYDIWGDAVNTASRMESSGVPGKVNISGETYELVKDHFSCTHRGKVHAKNKGEIDMYIVDESKENPA